MYDAASIQLEPIALVAAASDIVGQIWKKYSLARYVEA